MDNGIEQFAIQIALHGVVIASIKYVLGLDGIESEKKIQCITGLIDLYESKIRESEKAMDKPYKQSEGTR